MSTKGAAVGGDVGVAVPVGASAMRIATSAWVANRPTLARQRQGRGWHRLREARSGWLAPIMHQYM